MESSFWEKNQTHWKQLRALINPLIHNPCIYPYFVYRISNVLHVWTSNGISRAKKSLTAPLSILISHSAVH